MRATLAVICVLALSNVALGQEDEPPASASAGSQSPAFKAPDRPLHVASIDICLLRLPPTDDPQSRVDQFRGARAEALAALQRLRAAGQAGVIKHLQLSVLESVSTRVHFGQTTRVITARNVPPGGYGSNAYRDVQTGTIVELQYRVVDDTLVMELSFEDSDLPPPAAQRDHGADDVDVPQAGPETVTVKTTVECRSGEAVPVAAVETLGAGEVILIVAGQLSGTAVPATQVNTARHRPAASPEREVAAAPADDGDEERGDRFTRYARAVMRKYDRDGNGVLQAEEWGASRMALRYETLDRDGNGAVDLDEFTSALRSLRPENR